MNAEHGVSHFYTKVAGVSYPNDDGTSRQSIIRRCKVLERLLLEHDEDNPHDANAIRVLRESGEQLGFLPAHVAPRIVEGTAQGCRYATFIGELTGGTAGAETRGANLLVVVAEAWVSEADIVKYINQNIDEASAHLPGRTGCATGAAALIAVAAALALL